jgi:hypothetical protein
MNNLPNEVLLKIFGKVNWKYQIYHPLNLICKRWNDLIKRHEIDFDTDYNTKLILVSVSGLVKPTLSPHFRKSNLIIKTDMYVFFNKKTLLEKLLLKIPAYKLHIDDEYGWFNYTPRLIDFHNKHIKNIILYSYNNYLTKLNSIETLTIHYLSSKSLVYKESLFSNNLKTIKFLDVYDNVDNYILDILPYCNNIKFIEFKNSTITNPKYLFEIFSISKPTCYLIFENCIFSHIKKTCSKFVFMFDNYKWNILPEYDSKTYGSLKKVCEVLKIY